MSELATTITTGARGELAAEAAAWRRLGRPAGGRAGGSAGGWPWRDIGVAAVLVLLAALVYAPLALRLAHGAFALYDNLGFDFDPTRTLATLVGTPADRQGFKHPFMVLLRPLVWPFLAAGFTPLQAAGLVMAGFGALLVAVVYGFLRACGIGRPEAGALGLLFLVGGTPIFTAIIVETYGPAAFCMALVWLIARRRMDDPARWRPARLVVAAVVFGITITNVMQPVIAEAMVAWRRARLAATAGRLVGFGLALGLLVAVLALAIWPDGIWAAIRHPLTAAREVYWLQTKGERTGIGGVLATFFGYSFVSPGFTVIRLPEGVDMLDFRAPILGPVGVAALALWIGFWGVGAVAGLRHPGYRPVACGLAVALLANLLLHLDYQFRGSLYLYSAHLHFLIFALGAGLAPWLTGARWRWRGAYIGVVLVLAGLTGADNIAAARDFVTRFDVVRVVPPCAGPCARPVAPGSPSTVTAPGG
ncbi:MAG: hypothetical protein BGP12_08980 [Rhodospirillales bacterium 70-18]|nr:hypothetical protein [Rhodospirillales bacterium]OJY73220.1 MAG: hypothetical protein BGP12_08980 [Rhodospirillales bacterium 70-18]